MVRKLVVAVISIAGMAGCASVPMGDAKEDAGLKLFSVKPNVAGVYIY